MPPDLEPFVSREDALRNAARLLQHAEDEMDLARQSNYTELGNAWVGYAANLE